jgi:hypothetical protein
LGQATGALKNRFAIRDEGIVEATEASLLATFTKQQAN